MRQATDIVQHYTDNGPAEKNAQYWKSSVTAEIMAMQLNPSTVSTFSAFLPQLC